MIDMEKLKFDEKGLIPAIVVDGKSGQVLTLAYMNKESLEISIKEERTCFWSRSRQELWRKGETSGAVQHIRRLRLRRPGHPGEQGRPRLPHGGGVLLPQPPL